MAPSKQEQLKDLEYQFADAAKAIGKLLVEKINDKPKPTLVTRRAEK